jgi:predicted anti-sigma-YlaC factor YlaD
MNKESERMNIHYRKYFLDYAENRLSPRKKAEVDEHLKHCPVCRNYFEQMQTLLAPVAEGQKPGLTLNEWEFTRLQQRIREAGPETPTRRFRYSWQFSFSLLLFLAISLGIWLGRGLTERITPVQNQAMASAQSLQTEANYDMGFDLVWETLVEETVHED